MKCYEKCQQQNKSCKKRSCRYWIDYNDDLNCSIICANENGPLTLEEVAKRLNKSYETIRLIEKKATEKMKYDF